MINQSIQTFLLRGSGVFLPLLICTLFSGCSPSHILSYREDISRDYTYIDFTRNCDPFEVTSQVGGEHTRYIKILGFEGDKFLVELRPVDGNVMFSISGSGFDIRKCQKQMETILVRDMEAIISVGVSAHPYGDYTLTITKL